MKNSERSGSQLQKHFNPSQGPRINPTRSLTKLPGFLILLFGFLLILNACGSEEPAPTPTPNEPDPTGSILVKITTTGRDDDPEGYTLNVEGSAPREVAANSEISIPDQRLGRFTIELSNIANHCTGSGNMVREVNVTADGTATVEFEVDCKAILRDRIAYPKGEGGNNLKFYSAKLDGTDERLILDKVIQGGIPLISPDGTKVLFNDRLEGTNLLQIFVMDADGENLEMIPSETPDGPSQLAPVWHPDSKKISFVIGTEFGTYDLESKERRIISLQSSNNSSFQVTDVFESGNKFLGIFIDRSDNSRKVAVINSDGSGLTIIKNDPTFLPTRAEILDENTIIYLQRPAPNSFNEIWKMDIDGSNDGKVSDKFGFESNEIISNFTISPDRNEFVFWVSRVGEIYFSRSKLNGTPQRINFQSNVFRGRPNWSQATRR